MCHVTQRHKWIFPVELERREALRTIPQQSSFLAAQLYGWVQPRALSHTTQDAAPRTVSETDWNAYTGLA